MDSRPTTMRFNILLGPPKSGKTTALLDCFRETTTLKPKTESQNLTFSPSQNVTEQEALVGGHAMDSPSSFPSSSKRDSISQLLWICPNQRAADSIRSQLFTKRANCFLATKVLTFDQLAEQILLDSPTPLHQVSTSLKRFELAQIISEALSQGKLTYFKSTAEISGFVNLIANFISELKRRGLSSNAFTKMVGSRGQRQKHRELAYLYAAYQARLNTGHLYDTEGRQLSARRELLEQRQGKFRYFDKIVIDGFTDFLPVQYELITTLAKRTDQFFITLPMRPPKQSRTVTTPQPILDLKAFISARLQSDGDLLAKPLATLHELNYRYPQANVTLLTASHRSFPALNHTLDHLFLPPDQIVPASASTLSSLDKIQFIEAANQQDEIVQLAEHVKLLLTTDQVPPAEILVIFRSLTEATPRIEEIFTEFGIPISLESQPLLGKSPSLRTLLNLLRLDAEDWPFQLLLDIIGNQLLTNFNKIRPRKNDPATALLSLDTSEPTPILISARATTENLIRKFQTPTGREDLLNLLQHTVFRLAEELAENPEKKHLLNQYQTALALLTLLSDSLKNLPRKAAPNQWVSALESLAKSLGLTLNLKAENDRKSEKSEAQAAWSRLKILLDEYERLAGWNQHEAPTWTRHEFITILTDLLANESLPRLHDDVGRVRVFTAMTARSLTAPYVFLAGMSEQAFPSPERTDQMYGNADYQFFRSASAKNGQQNFVPLLSEPHQDEMLLFYEIISRATRQLTISYPALDSKAQPLNPSPFVTELERTFGEQTLSRVGLPDLNPIPSRNLPLSSSQWRLQAVDQALQGDPKLLAGLIANRSPESLAVPNLLAGIRAVLQRQKGPLFSQYEGMFASEVVKSNLENRYGTEHLWSPSQLETYAKCPHSFYLKHVLKLRPLDELTLETNHRQRGSLMHDALAAVHSTLQDIQQIVDEHGDTSDPLIEELRTQLTILTKQQPLSGLQLVLREIDCTNVLLWGGDYRDQAETYEQHWSEWDTPMMPAFYEVRFGPSHSGDAEEDPKSTDTPLEIHCDGIVVRVCGRIDRIDVGSKNNIRFFNIIDYKTGKSSSSTSLKLSQVNSGERLQLPLYAIAAKELLFPGEEVFPYMAGYWSIRDNGFKVKKPRKGSESSGALELYQTLDPEETKAETEKIEADSKNSSSTPSLVRETDEWLAAKQQVFNRLKEIVSGIKNGEFPMECLDEKCTSTCEYSTVCRVAQTRSLNKVRNLPTESEPETSP